MKRALWWMRLNLMIIGASYILAANLGSKRYDYASDLNGRVFMFFLIVSGACALPADRIISCTKQPQQ